MLVDGSKIDETFHTWKDEGHCPDAMGTYHFYHRIDGILAAVGVVDITSRYLNSAYFIYDPDFMFLNMGVVGAIRELEFCRKIQKTRYPGLVYY
jgi:arginyl-tRNA--protein-N-Asp/Glu arginylyltransferase